MNLFWRLEFTHQVVAMLWLSAIDDRENARIFLEHAKITYEHHFAPWPRDPSTLYFPPWPWARRV